MQYNIYITDTSALFPLIQDECGFCEPDSDKKRKRINNLKKIVRQLLQKRYYKIVVPAPVLIELISPFFHRSIDLTDYDTWYRQRSILINQHLIGPIYNTSSKISYEPGSRVSELIALQLTHAKIPSAVCSDLAGYHTRKKNHHRYDPKLFDGMDAAIVAIAIQVALRNPDSNCYFLSEDRWLRYGINYTKSLPLYKNKLNHLSFKTLHDLKRHL